MKTEDAEAVIDLVAKISSAFDATMTPEERAARELRPRDETSAALVYSANQREEALDDFATLAAVDSLRTMADEIQTVIDARMQKVYADSLAVYYALVDLAAKEPENELYMHHMREMESAHLSQYGLSIPPRQ